MPLPGVAPAAVQAAHLIGVRTGHKNLHPLAQRKNALVLQQHGRFLGRVKRSLGESLAAEVGIVGKRCVRPVKQPETILQAKNPAHGIVNPAHRNLTLFHERLQRVTEIVSIRNHRHIDPGVYRKFHGFLHVSGDLFALVEIVYVGPVGDDHTVPAGLVLEPLSEQNRVAVNRSSVD